MTVSGKPGIFPWILLPYKLVQSVWYIAILYIAVYTIYSCIIYSYVTVTVQHMVILYIFPMLCVGWTL